MTAYNGLHNKEDMIGLHFNKWTVLGYSHKDDCSGNWYYHCRCTCGEIATVKGSNLRNDTSKQCKQCSGKANGRKGIYAQNEGTDLYFIRCLQFVKIGTTANLSERLRTIKSSNPFALNLEYYGVQEGYREEYWHNVFKDKLHQGEWYWLTDGDMEKVKQFKGEA